MTLAAGTRLGSYEIHSALGAGGMGEVYRATDTTLGRAVALKVVSDSFTHDPERVARFRREAQLLAALNHPHIATIHGLEEADGAQFLVMELVEGETLAARIGQGPIPMEEALRIARQIAEALQAAHDKGIIHRDLKPSNIALTADGQIKVLDFGLAKALESSSGNALDSPALVTHSPTLSIAATQAGVVLGTAAYMAPEQAKGKPADRRADIWAFGCVLYEMLTGMRPFEGQDAAETLAFVMAREPDWRAVPADLSVAVRALLRGCLEKDRTRRVGDIAAARFALDLPSTPVPAAAAAPRAGTRRSRAVAAVAAAVLLTGAFTGAAVWRLLPAAAARVVRFSIVLPQDQQLSAITRHYVAVSHDGTQLAYVANNRIYVRSLAEFETRALTGTDELVTVYTPAFAPDGGSIAFYSSQDRAIKRVAATGGAAVTLCPTDVQPGSMSWEASGILFSQPEIGVFRCSANGGKPEQLAAVHDGEIAHGPQLLLDGRALLFTIANEAGPAGRWDAAHVVVQTLATGERKTILTGGTDARYLPTGHLVYAARGVLFAVPFDPERHVVTGDPVPVVEGVRRANSTITGAAQIAVAASGTLVYVPGPAQPTVTERVLALADRAGMVSRLAAPAGPYDHVRASRDGAWLAIGTDDGQQANVWIYDVAGKTAVRRLTFGGRNRYPIWSPDGRRVAFQSDREGDAALFAQSADGTGTVERLTKAGSDEAHVAESWSPDGRSILYSVRKGNRFSLWLLSVGDGKTAPYGGVESTSPIGAVFSPDGRWIAYAAVPEGPAGALDRGVYVQPFPATGPRYQVPKQQSLDFHPVWARNGDELLYIPSASSGQLSIVGVARRGGVAFGNPANVPARVTAGRISIEMRAYDILPDGRLVGLLAASELDPSGGSGSSDGIRVVLNWHEELKRLVPTD